MKSLRHVSRLYFSCVLLLTGLVLSACQNGSSELAETVALTVRAPDPATSDDLSEPTLAAPTAAVEQEVVIIAPTTEGVYPIDLFFEEALITILSREPEWLTSTGLSKELGVMLDDQLSQQSSDYDIETIEIFDQLRSQLLAHDRDLLSAEDRLSYDILLWFLNDSLSRKEFLLYEYKLNQMIGVQWLTPQHMLNEHPLTDLADAEAYVSRLQQFGMKFSDAAESVALSAEQGIVPPRWMVDSTINQTRWLQSGSSDLFDHLEDALDRMEDVSDSDRARLLAEAQVAIDENVDPGYQILIDQLDELSSIADTDDGVWKHPNGDGYYAAALRHHTTTNISAEEIHTLGLAEVERIQAEMQVHFDELGYPDDTVINNMQRIAQDGGFMQVRDGVDRQAALDEYASLIDEAQVIVSPYFDLLPESDIEVRSEREGVAYYTAPAVDGSRPGYFFAALGNQPVANYGMPTLAYHEGVPGHHFQVALQTELEGLPRFRNVFNYTAYAEGWALYAEELMAELGVYDDDPYGDIGRLQSELFRAVRLVVDTGIHHKQWTREEAHDYMLANTGFPRGMVSFEIDRYIAWPGQATAYKVGQLKIIELRERMQLEMGDEFDLKLFHNLMLQNGAMPLPVLESVVDDYLASR